MGQKVNPIGLRLGVNQKWKSSWFCDTQNYKKFIYINFNINKIIKSFLLFQNNKYLLVDCKIFKNMENKLFIFVSFYKSKSIINHKKKFLLKKKLNKKKLIIKQKKFKFKKINKKIIKKNKKKIKIIKQSKFLINNIYLNKNYLKKNKCSKLKTYNFNEKIYLYIYLLKKKINLIFLKLNNFKNKNYINNKQLNLLIKKFIILYKNYIYYIKIYFIFFKKLPYKIKYLYNLKTILNINWNKNKYLYNIKYFIKKKNKNYKKKLFNISKLKLKNIKLKKKLYNKNRINKKFNHLYILLNKNLYKINKYKFTNLTKINKKNQILLFLKKGRINNINKFNIFKINKIINILHLNNFKNFRSFFYKNLINFKFNFTVLNNNKIIKNLNLNHFIYNNPYIIFKYKKLYCLNTILQNLCLEIKDLFLNKYFFRKKIKLLNKNNKNIKFNNFIKKFLLYYIKSENIKIIWIKIGKKLTFLYKLILMFFKWYLFKYFNIFNFEKNLIIKFLLSQNKLKKNKIRLLNNNFLIKKKQLNNNLFKTNLNIKLYLYKKTNKKLLLSKKILKQWFLLYNKNLNKKKFLKTYKKIYNLLKYNPWLNKNNINKIKFLSKYLNKKIKFLNKNFIINKNYYLNKSFFNSKLFINILKKKEYKFFNLKKSNIFKNFNNLKKILKVITKLKISFIFVNIWNIMKFNYQLKKNNILYKNLLKKIQFNFFSIKRLENNLIRRWRRVNFWTKDLINISIISMFFKNPFFLANFITYQLTFLPKNKIQTSFLKFLTRVIFNFKGERKEIISLKLQFKGRFNKWTRTKKWIASVGSLLLQTYNANILYAYSKGLVKKGIFSTKIWLQYKKNFNIKLKNILIKYFKYSKIKYKIKKI